ncbi:ATP-dependent DNA helicase RecG [Prochlorococcus sp. MIT 1341]|uniref:ATP-dependent DNA helicase RecG n=1 Tax=Prochlorococcus sp. MIT 1341 TaxID=3096221 RepID=UPI002A74F142|nr:ATP-dependent DNA helicase RecG [Prochlorococcus sp. MIT 1341]
MVGKSSGTELTGNSKNSLDTQQLCSVLDWIRLLQKAFTLEVEQGFNNLQGRREFFHEFAERQLLEFQEVPLPAETRVQLKELSTQFHLYPEKNKTSRRRLITKSRFELHRLSKHLQPESPIGPPHIRHAKESISNFSSHTKLNSSLSLESLLIDVKGVGPRFAEKLSALGIIFIKDLLEYYPRDYVDYSSLRRISDLRVGETSTIVANVKRSNGFKSPRNPNLSILELHLEDLTGKLKVTRFFAGRRFSSYAYIKSQANLYPPGSTVAVSGLVKSGDYGVSFQDPLIEVMENPSSPIRSQSIGRILSVYPLTEGLKADKFRELVANVLPLAEKFLDPLPPFTLKGLNLMPKSDAIVQIHKPGSTDLLQAARRRLVFDEFFFLQLGLLRKRFEIRTREAPSLRTELQQGGLVEKFLDLLPFSLTGAQERVLAEISSDVSKSEPMARLIQGDVGSGKTVVAIASLLKAVESGWQGALMAPTEVLADQHYRSLCKWLPQIHVNVELLTGSTPRLSRRRILEDLANGSIKILVGTHALIEDPVVFNRLGLVVVDEQHRFGVHQRNNLLGKGLQPHLLTMTATPIPRTLALSLHGDLDVSQIDELPPGRKAIKTSLLKGSERNRAYELIREGVEKGQRAYVVLPLVKDSEKLDLRSAVMTHQELSKQIFPEFEVGLLHGRMTSVDKQEIIRNFSSGQCQVLVSTTVVEVGVDVPEASIMVIEHAERFGLAQLHQLRGRVGRGSCSSYCLLINDSKTPLGKERLEVLTKSNDGFEIAEIDLRLRGPGQILGTRQSGLPDFALASLVKDADVLKQARVEAIRLLNESPDLISKGLLREMLDENWKKFSGKAHLN